MITIPVSIEKLSSFPTAKEEAARVLAEAFRTNPALIRCTGGDGPEQLNLAIRFYRLMLENSTGELTVAKEDGAITGVMQTLPSDRCQPGLLAQLRMMPSMMLILGRSMPNAARWFGAWGKRDPAEPHLHLGPIGVHPDRQGEGIGSKLMEHYLGQLDASAQAGYLETDKDINVRFYEKFGFRVMEELPVLGVPTWLMWRDAASR